MWAVPLLFIATANAGSKQNGSVSPVEKVANLLVKLHEKVEEEGRAEEVLFTKFDGFCQHQEKEKFWLSAKAAKRVGRLNSEIADHDAIVTNLKGQIDDIDTDITDTNADIDTQTADKIKEMKEFQDVITNLDEVIRQCKEAIVHLKTSDVSGTGLISTNVLTQALSLPHVEDASIKKLIALVEQEPGKPKAYKFHSSVVIELLENLLTQFKNKRLGEDNNAMTSRTQSEKAIQALKNEVKSLMNQKMEKQAESDANSEQKQNKQAIYDETVKDLDANTDFLQNLVGCQQVRDMAATEGATKLTAHLVEQNSSCPSDDGGECGMKRKNYADRVKTRGEELVALEEAIALLKGKGGGKYAASKPVVGLVSRHVAQSKRQDPTEPFETAYSYYAIRRRHRRDPADSADATGRPPKGENPGDPYPPGGPPHPAGDRHPPALGPPIEVEEITEVHYEPPHFFVIRPAGYSGRVVGHDGDEVHGRSPSKHSAHPKRKPPTIDQPLSRDDEDMADADVVLTDAEDRHDSTRRKAVRARHLRADMEQQHHDSHADDDVSDEWEGHDASTDELDEYDHGCHDTNGCDEDDEVDDSEDLEEDEDEDEDDRPSTFLQVSRKLTARKVLRFLKMRAKSLKSTQLSALLLKMKLKGDRFKEVRDLINQLVSRLEKQLSAETDDKAWCDQELKTKHAARDEAQTSIEEATSNVDSETARKSLLQTEIDELRKQIAEGRAAKQEQEEIRLQEKKQNRQTIEDAKEGEKAVKEAIKVLQKFYEADGDVLLQKQEQIPKKELYRAEGSDSEGRTIADMRPESDVFEGTYGGSQTESKGIIAILKIIESDYALTTKSVETSEGESQKSWTESDGKLKVDIEDSEDQVKIKSNNKDEADENITDYETDLVDAQALHKTIEGELAALKPLCSAAESQEQLEERRKRRNQEIGALREALTILREV